MGKLFHRETEFEGEHHEAHSSIPKPSILDKGIARMHQIRGTIETLQANIDKGVYGATRERARRLENEALVKELELCTDVKIAGDKEGFYKAVCEELLARYEKN